MKSSTILSQKAGAPGETNRSLERFWVLAGSFVPEETPAPCRARRVDEVFLAVAYRGRGFERAPEAVVSPKPLPL